MIRITSKLVLSAVLAVVPALALAQAPRVDPGAVPPRLSEAARRENRQQVLEGVAMDMSQSSFGMTAKSSMLLGNVLGGTTDLASGMRAADIGGNIVKGAAIGGSLAIVGAKEGMAGIYREGAQLTLDTAVTTAAEQALVRGWAIPRALASGVGGAAASGGASVAFEGGVMIGNVIKRYRWEDGTTIEGRLNDWYFEHTPDGVKEALSGTPQVDVDSADFQRRQALEIQRRARQHAFERVRRENEQQQAQIQAASAQDAGSAAQEANPDASTVALLGALSAGIAQYKGKQMSVAAGAAAPYSSSVTKASQCTLDPRTGCHPGHDEKSHPGGCKCGR